MADGVGPQAFGDAVLRVRAQPDGAVVGAGFLVTDELALTCAHVVSAAVSTRDDEPPPDGTRLLVDLPLTGDDAVVTATVERWLPPDPAGPDVAMLRLPCPGRAPVGRSGWWIRPAACGTLIAPATCPPDLKLLHLLRWLDPDGPVIYRGRPVTYERVVDVCLTGRFGDAGPDRALLTDLGEQRLLDVLAGFTELGDLAGAQERWDDLSAKWQRIVGGAVILPSEVRREAHSITGLLLVAAIAHPYAVTRLRAAARHGGEPPPTEHDYWFRSLVEEAGGPDSSLGLVVRARFTGQARTDAQVRAYLVARRAQDKRGREEKEAAHAERERAWAAYEASRLTIAARLGAFGRAVAWHGLWAAFAVVATWFVWGWSDPYVAQLVSIEIALIVGIAVIIRRAVEALFLGAAYRPPLWQIGRWFPANARTAASGARTKLLPAAAFILIGGAAAQWGENTAGAAHGLGEQLAGTASSIAIVVIFCMAFIYAYSVGSRLRRWDEDYQAALRNRSPDHDEPHP